MVNLFLKQFYLTTENRNATFMIHTARNIILGRLSICRNTSDLIWTDIFGCCGYKIWKLFSLVRLKIIGDLSEMVMILISLCEPLKRMAVVIRSLCSTFHIIYIAMNCLFVACSGGQRWKHSCGYQKMCESLSLSLSFLTFLCESYKKLWQTNLTLWAV